MMEYVFTYLRDSAYNVVAQEGDIALQFLGDLIRGVESSKQDYYHQRQLERSLKKKSFQERKQAQQQKALKSQNTKPLTSAEKNTFVKMLQRQKGESQIEHWKRKKMLLSYPQKRALIKDYNIVQKRLDSVDKKTSLEAQKKAQQKLEEEFKQITQLKHRSRHMHKM